MEAADPTFAAVRDAKERGRRAGALADEANAFSLVSHLQWSLWGLIQAANSNIDFDYLEYAAQRLRAYFDWRDPYLRALVAANTRK